MSIDHVSRDNLDTFLEALGSFGHRKGNAAADAWLFKLNPEAQRHVEMEMTSTGDGYSPAMVWQIVRGEFQNSPIPQPCPRCDTGVAWYRATASVMKCDGCGETLLHEDVDWIHTYDHVAEHAAALNAGLFD